MIRHRLRTALAAGVAVLTLATASVPARAQWIVFDPTNFSQNVLTAARELQQVNKNIQSLENQATMLINQANNLASLPYSSLAQLEPSIQQTEQLLTQAQRIAYSVTTIDQAFTQVYPQSYSSATSSAQLLADAQTRWQNARAGYQDSMHVQAGVVQNLQNAQTQINALVSSSQSASGALQAAQSGNQLMGLAAQQLADLTARHRRDGPRPEPRRRAQAGEPGTGASSRSELPQLRRRLSARLRADVPLMRGRLLNIPRHRPRGRLRPGRRGDRRGSGAVRSPGRAAVLAGFSGSISYRSAAAANSRVARRSGWPRRTTPPARRPGRKTAAASSPRSTPRSLTPAVAPRSQAMGGTGVIDGFLGTFTQYIDSGFGLVQGDVRWLAGVLIAIDITLAGLFWALAPDEDVLARLIKKTLYIGVFAFIIGNYNNLAQIIYNSFAGLGIEAGGGTMNAAQLLQPGKLAQVGIDAGKPILTSISGMMGFTSVFENFVQIAILLVAWLIVVISFFIMAIQLFVSLIEFKLTTLAGFVLVPFGLFGRTAFLAEKVLGNVVSSGVKILVLAVIVGIGSTIFGQFTTGFNNPPTISDALTLILAALTLLGLSIFGPGIANGLIAGGPQLGAGAAVGTGLAVAGIGAAGAGLVAGGVRRHWCCRRCRWLAPRAAARRSRERPPRPTAPAACPASPKPPAPPR